MFTRFVTVTGLPFASKVRRNLGNLRDTACEARWTTIIHPYGEYLPALERRLNDGNRKSTNYFFSQFHTPIGLYILCLSRRRESSFHGREREREKRETPRYQFFMDVELSVRLLFAVNGKKKDERQPEGKGKPNQRNQPNSDAAVRENPENAGI